MLLKLGNLSEAEAQYRELIKGNPENLKYFKGLEACLKLTPQQGTFFISSPTMFFYYNFD
jgi:hypothetical protein